MLNRALRTTVPVRRNLTSTPSRTFTSTPLALKVYDNVDAETFKSRVLAPSAADADTPVLVDFFATWCQPCKLLSPALRKVATQPDVVGGKQVDLVTIDVDIHQDIAREFKVSAMPTVVAMKNGKVLDGFVGMLPEKKVIEFVQNLK
ncbi:related to Thioredoxin [Melanopsichium pennsylvanicum]|uniref:Related to Thioredoxin n=2 Tax=Melanopsichium pennsylvanicum TaxID=63383 RepID=A0AAJ5C3L4_9BASI|nr:related to Thioredoxin [Melanopsichium pennsylvanicum 4]SNX82756.1 related to Thioredoxin [Melanopsichium pennsylvanicum]